MLNLYWYGTFSFKLESNSSKILIDPFIRYDKIDDSDFINNFLDVEDVFITHGHLDHTAHLKRIYNNKKIKIHVTKTPYKRLLKDGLSYNQLVNINYGDMLNTGNFSIKVLHSKHIRFDLKLIFQELFNKDVIKYRKNLLEIIKQHLLRSEAGETVSYFIEVDKTSFLFMGSMALNKDTKYPTNVDYLVLAYQGRSDLDKKIIPVIDTINPKNIILGHFDNSFPPVSKSVDVSGVKKMYDGKINIIIPKHDEVLTLKK